MFYRHVKFGMTFICRKDSIEVFRQSEIRSVEIDPVEFFSREDAYNIGGDDLEKWARNFAQKIAEQLAGDYCPGPTIVADDVNVYIEDFSEADTKEDLYKVEKKKVIPSYIRAAIQVTLERIAGNLDDIDYVNILTKDLDKILEDNKLTREDISDMIKKLNLEEMML